MGSVVCKPRTKPGLSKGHSEVLAQRHSPNDRLGNNLGGFHYETIVVHERISGVQVER